MDHPARRAPLQPEPQPETSSGSGGRPQADEFGPYGYLIKKILPRLNAADLRIYGVNHVDLAWMTVDRDVDQREGESTNNLSSTTVPLLTRATAPAAATGQGGMAAMMDRGPIDGHERAGWHGRDGPAA